VTDAGSGDVGWFGGAGDWDVRVVWLRLGSAFCWWLGLGLAVCWYGNTCEEHVFSGEAGEALLKVDGLGDRDG
jgi:hypothetical protein